MGAVQLASEAEEMESSRGLAKVVVVEVGRVWVVEVVGAMMVMKVKSGWAQISETWVEAEAETETETEEAGPEFLTFETPIAYAYDT
jgi:hypothetical protein